MFRMRCSGNDKAAELAFGGLLQIGTQEGGGLVPIDSATASGGGAAAKVEK